MNFFYNYVAVIPWITFLLAIIIKWIIIKCKTKRSDFQASIWSWWMPSVHSAVASSLATAIALKDWFWSDLFALALTFCVIVIYDSINVRYEAWLHAEALNDLVKNWKKYKESLWHLPWEALAWIFLWIFVSVICYLI